MPRGPRGQKRTGFCGTAVRVLPAPDETDAIESMLTELDGVSEAHTVDDEDLEAVAAGGSRECLIELRKGQPGIVRCDPGSPSQDHESANASRASNAPHKRDRRGRRERD